MLDQEQQGQAGGTDHGHVDTGTAPYDEMWKIWDSLPGQRRRIELVRQDLEEELDWHIRRTEQRALTMPFTLETLETLRERVALEMEQRVAAIAAEEGGLVGTVVAMPPAGAVA